MKKNFVIPVVLLATTPFVVACTKSPTDMPPPPPVTGNTETIAPEVAPIVEETPIEVVNPVEETPTTSQIDTQSTLVTRTETVYYETPAGSHPVEFSVTTDDGVITAVNVAPKADHEISQKLQSAFALGIADVAVGKKASDLNLDIVAGASLTTGAFNMYVRSF